MVLLLDPQSAHAMFFVSLRGGDKAGESEPLIWADADYTLNFVWRNLHMPT